ncbi:hypothetical protein F751_6143 [Auxenochlorella protothecoides]|uniref:Fe/B12 periplasmic-binding domain-containing protein n=1 Tax=Auxenochlorella protothecoides TaxID=3075 RepID=A0A087SHI4_AUXPR|nr:hypothetical protein F751_6143 [Auxenochlorella protothecoides]KFM25188.1 hypothetical protein F751_6143 [Auxenochlorella protothecoides]
MTVRVVSLLPSATEIVTKVILAQGPAPTVQLVGKSHECDYGPTSLAGLPILTAARTNFTTSADVDEQVRTSLAAGESLYSVDRDLLRSLKPDVVLTQSLCKVCSVDFRTVQAAVAEMQPPPILVDLSPQNLWEVLDDLTRRIAAVRSKLAERREQQGTQSPSVLMAEWTDPIFVGGHWTPQLVHMAGGSHVLNPGNDEGGAGKSYACPFADVAQADPDWLIVAPCGLDIPTTKREMAPLVAQPGWTSLKAVKKGQVVIVDGNQMFNRSGPRLVDALEFLYSLLWNEPQAMPAGFPYEMWSDARQA